MRLILLTILLPGLLAHSLDHTRRERTCTTETAIIRREWGSLTSSERTNYIDAVLCAQNTPSELNLPATKSRFDDFAAVHINLTRSIHNNGVFFHWHRHYVYLWEKFLRDECNYAGYQPYWNWALWPNLAASPLFDGSMTSLGGDGEPIPDRPPTIIGSTGLKVPPGNGGGCMKSGPFVNMTVTMGPFAFSDLTTGLPSNWSDYNPRCLPRDLNDGAYQFNNQTMIELALEQPEIGALTDFVNSGVAGEGLGLHSGGHFAIGPVMFDTFASPFDPAFFVHHAMLDKLWLDWQEIDFAERQFQYNGTSTVFNGNSTPPVTNETDIYFPSIGTTVKVMDVVDVKSGFYCYRYE
ncbi:hypothetical protein J7T55_009913 [Diaporthe amygdali]|uniref:uncharacterized protein n=1 Tax=Phomopsis amygdali TaxID=1214568 RepID=UPI0022FE7F29|nr:uncharacterized protein J7T55_009913 [Diaporthe amygdali]KAJ0116762.1 hypothetical protein J7T55_009913 [Diaporthe amygdali]